MSEFLYLFRGGSWADTPEGRAANMQKWAAWIKGLSEKGHFKGGEPLDGGGKVLRGKQKTVTDGPFAEAKDLVGGYLLVSAENLDHAVELARGCPIFEGEGTVEVRPVTKM